MQPDPSLLDDLARRLASSLPGSLRQARDDAERNFRAVLESALSRLDLVGREEFDAQTAVLRRTRERLEEMTERLARLEEQKGGNTRDGGNDPGG